MTERSRLSAVARRAARGTLWLLFAAILLVPKFLALQRRARIWNAVRLAMALAGLVLIWQGVSAGKQTLIITAGLLLLIGAVSLAPRRQRASVDERAREWGARIVLDGGRYRGSTGRFLHVLLFLKQDRLVAVDQELKMLLEIPLAQITALQVLPEGAGWKLRLQYAESAAEFAYQGTFAEHMAKVAEANLKSMMNRSLPVLR